MASRGELNAAITAWREAHLEEPRDEVIASRYADALADAGRKAELAEFIPTSPLPEYNKSYYLLRADEDNLVIDLATEVLSEPGAIKEGQYDGRAILRINRAIALKRLGRAEEMRADLSFLEQNGDTAEAALRAGVAALKKDRKTMFEALEEALGETLAPKSLMVFPVFEDYRDDAEFLDLVRMSQLEEEWSHERVGQPGHEVSEETGEERHAGDAG